MQQAIEIMRSEHRTLGAAIHALVGIVDSVVIRGGAPNFDVLRALLQYIDQYPDQFHHPKEDRYLFRLLVLRLPDCAALVQRLEDDHKVNKGLMIALCRLLEIWHANPDQRNALLRFQNELQYYADFHWAHMRREENELFPLATRHLLPEDWAEINEAFAGHHDPLVGMAAKEHYDEMLRRIVLHAPEPYGVGARW